jgi:hypothetical protein
VSGCFPGWPQFGRSQLHFPSTTVCSGTTRQPRRM